VQLNSKVNLDFHNYLEMSLHWVICHQYLGILDLTLLVLFLEDIVLILLT